MEITSFESVLERDGKLVFKTRGTSMKPMLRQGRDLVIIEPKTGRLRKFDVALFRMGDKYVLHRVVAVRGGYYITRGDNRIGTEKPAEEDVFGVLTSFVRNGKTHSAKSFSHRVYAAFWTALLPVRTVAGKVRSKCKKGTGVRNDTFRRGGT